MISRLAGFIQDTVGITIAAQSRLLLSLAIITLLFVLRWLIYRLIWRKTTDLRTRFLWGKTLTYIFVFMGLLLVGNVWIRGFKGIGTFLGLLSAGIAIALKDPLANLAAWLFILLRRPISVGDRVQIGEVAGDVIDIRPFQFLLLEIGNWVGADQSTGRIIYVPNGRVFSHPVANYTKGFDHIWNEINVVVTFESNWQKAKSILESAVQTHADALSKAAERKIRAASRKYMIFYKNLTPIIYTRVVDHGVQLTLRYLCEPRNRRGTEHEIWEQILTEFAQCDDIDFAYPTQRFYQNPQEGKPGTKPPAGSN